jgi:hypothetical protein
VGRHLDDALDVGAGEAAEDREVLGHGCLLGRLDHRIEVRVTGAALDRVELVADEGERGAQLDEGQHPPAARLDAVDQGLVEVVGAADRDGRLREAERPVEVDQLAGGEVVRERP